MRLPSPAPSGISMGQRDWLVIGVLVVAALALHTRAMFTFAYIHDEVGVIQRQIGFLLGAAAERSPWTFLIDAPLACSNALTPLWGWQHFVFAELFGASHTVTRLLPTLWTLGPIVLSYRLVLPRLGRLTAACTAGTFVVLDTVLWTGTKSEFTESMLTTCVIGALLFALRGSLRAFWYGALLLGLTPLTYFGKGLFLYGTFGAWVLAAGIALGWKDLSRRFLALGASLLPTGLWLLAAGSRIKALVAAGTPIASDMGLISSIQEQIRSVTVDYFQHRPFLKGTPGAVMIVYTDFKAWPTGTLLAPWALMGLLTGFRRITSSAGQARALLLTLPALGVLPFAYVVGNGYIGERFTLTWAFPFALAVGLGVSTAITGLLAPRGSPNRGWATGTTCVAWVGTAFALGMTSWDSWTFDSTRVARVALGGVALTWLAPIAADWTQARRLPGAVRSIMLERLAALTPLVPLAVLVSWSLLTYGPLLWGRAQGWGVEAINVREFEARLQRHDHSRGQSTARQQP